MSEAVKTAVLAGGDMSVAIPAADNMELSVVLTDDADSPSALAAQGRFEPLFVIERAMFPTQRSFDKALFEKLDDLDIDLVIMAGWRYPLSEDVLRRWERHILCLYPVLRRETAEIELTACLLERTGEPGAELVKRSIPLRAEDTAETLPAHIAEEGAPLLREAAAMICSGRLCIHGRQAKMLPELEEEP